MGVYIKGMEMPTSCRACLYSRTDIRNVDWCVLTEKDLPCDCPLIDVPPHGDLIDRDETMNAILEERGEDTACWFAEIVNDMPTIIPAEEGEP